MALPWVYGQLSASNFQKMAEDISKDKTLPSDVRAQFERSITGVKDRKDALRTMSEFLMANPNIGSAMMQKYGGTSDLARLYLESQR